MATIVSSVIAAQDVQRDGRIWVREVHTDSFGIKWAVTYLAADSSGIDAHLAASAISVLANAVNAEVDANVSGIEALGSLYPWVLNYSNASANSAALRDAYASATQFQAVMIGDALSVLTDGQLQNAFGLTAGQVTALRTNKLTPAANAAATIRATTGA